MSDTESDEGTAPNSDSEDNETGTESGSESDTGSGSDDDGSGSGSGSDEGSDDEDGEGEGGGATALQTDVEMIVELCGQMDSSLHRIRQAFGKKEQTGGARTGGKGEGGKERNGKAAKAEEASDTDSVVNDSRNNSPRVGTSNGNGLNLQSPGEEGEGKFGRSVGREVGGGRRVGERKRDRGERTGECGLFSLTQVIASSPFAKCSGIFRGEIATFCSVTFLTLISSKRKRSNPHILPQKPPPKNPATGTHTQQTPSTT